MNWKNKTFWKKALKFSFVAVAVGMMVLGAFITAVYFEAFGPVPSSDELAKIQNSEASIVYSADGVVLGKYYLQERTSVPYDSISHNVINALVATEDARFYDHNGVDYRALGRVLVRTFILRDKRAGGGSTITQQLAKNIYGRQDYPVLSMPITKVWEMIVAARLEDIYTKEQILTMYLNTVPFGENIYGISAASDRFFSKAAIDLDACQAATLVGMLKANGWYNPRRFPEKSLWRRNVVIDQLVHYDYISREEGDQLQAEPMNLAYHFIDHEHGPAPYFREQVRQRATEILAEIELDSTVNLYSSGLRIHTTVNSRLQKHAEAAVKSEMKGLQATFDKHWPGQKLWRNNEELIDLEIKRSPDYKQLIAEGLSPEKAKEQLATPAQHTLFSWDGNVEKEVSTRDAIKHQIRQLQTGFIATDPHNGAVLAWVGGINFEHYKYDHVMRGAKRQVGSTFKPLVYATALEQGVSPCKYYKAEEKTYEVDGEEWTPSNSGGEEDGRYSMAGALTNSVNTVSVQVLEAAGIDNVIATAQNAGITSDLPRVPSLALGVAEISMREMAEAYGAFAAKGVHRSSHIISRIEDAKGNVIWRNPATEETRVLSERSARITLELMKGVVDHGTGNRLRRRYGLTNEIAGKTGTTQGNSDGWFMGVTPNMVCATWVGGTYRPISFRTTALGQGANTALPIYADFLIRVRKDKSVRQYGTGSFSTMKTKWVRQTTCDEYKDGMNIRDLFFKKHKEDDSSKNEPMKRIKGLFHRKKQ